MARPTLDFDYRRRFDPTRKPTWRYDKVQRSLDAQEPLHPTRDDVHTQELRRYYQTKRQLQARIADQDKVDDALAARYQDLWAAEKIWRGGDNARERYHLESNILARRTPAEIADRVSTSPEAIICYEKVFFNVVDRLKARDYISSQVLGPTFMSGLSSRSMAITFKYFAYFAGPHVLDLIADGFTDEIASPMEPSELSQWIDRQFRSRIRTNAMVGITFFEPTSYNIRTLLEGFQGLLSLSHKEMSQTGDDNVINRAIQGFIAQAPAPKGDDADKLPSRPGPSYGGGAVEPRVGELELIALGKPVPRLEYYGDTWDDPKKRRLDKPTTQPGPAN